MKFLAENEVLEVPAGRPVAYNDNCLTKLILAGNSYFAPCL